MTSDHIGQQVSAVQNRWLSYQAKGDFDHFVEFTLALNSLAELLSRLRVPGLVRQCEALESAALALFGDPSTHPMGKRSIEALQRQIEPLLGAILTARRQEAAQERRMRETQTAPRSPEWIKPRSVWVIAEPGDGWIKGLREQLRFYGFRVATATWRDDLPKSEAPFAVILAPGDDAIDAQKLTKVETARARCPTSQLFYVGVPRELGAMVALMRAGIDITIQREERAAALLSRILDLVQTQEQECYKVLVVEDSRVAIAQIQRALTQHGIDSRVVPDPIGLLDTLEAYRPDLILMDMYMPHCNGVEATRALRQLPAYRAVPIVYLSSETDIGLQIEALRLGGDQFLTKPFNPVVLTATLKTKIERHREMQRATLKDGLTGLFNHTAAKVRLDAMVATLPPGGQLTVAMLDIDRFKSVNDTYGHPVGDQVIRSLAWLLTGRLRSSDLIGRYGGEEFILALQDVGPEEAWVVLDHIRRDFAKLPHVHAGGTMHATFSAGLAAISDVATASDLVNKADEALLKAKRRGRNRVEHIGSGAATPAATGLGTVSASASGGNSLPANPV